MTGGGGGAGAGGEGGARRQGRGQVGRGQRNMVPAAALHAALNLLTRAGHCLYSPRRPAAAVNRGRAASQPASQPGVCVPAHLQQLCTAPPLLLKEGVKATGTTRPAGMRERRGGSVQAQLGPLVHVPMTSWPAAAGAVPTSAATADVHHFHCCCCCCCLVAAAPLTCWPGP